MSFCVFVCCVVVAVGRGVFGFLLERGATGWQTAPPSDRHDGMGNNNKITRNWREEPRDNKTTPEQGSSQNIWEFGHKHGPFDSKIKHK